VQGLILGAGQGRRLQPLTCIVAKPALRIVDKPLIWHIVRSLIQLGVNSIFVTLYHKAESVLTLGLEAQFGLPIDFLIEPELLGTGGGIKNAMRFITDDHLLICNGDALWVFNLKPVVDEHITSGRDLTLVLTATSDWQEYSAIRTDEGGRVVRIGTLAEIPHWTGHLSAPYTFTGIYILNTSLLEHLPNMRVFDFVSDFIVPLMMSGFHIQGSVVTGFWMDIGTFERYLRGSLHFAERIKGTAVKYVAGQDCSIAEGAEVVNCILWDYVSIAPHAQLRSCIAVDWVNLDTPVQLENALLFPDRVVCSELTEFDSVHVSHVWAFPVNLSSAMSGRQAANKQGGTQK